MDFEKLSDNRKGESSETIRARMEKAREKQKETFADLNNQVMNNADMRVAEVRRFCELEEAVSNLLRLQ